MNPIEVTFYARTGYSYSDEPASDAVIDMNEHWNMPSTIQSLNPENIPNNALKVWLSNSDLHRVDYIKLTDTVTHQRWYYFVVGHQNPNGEVVWLNVLQDSFATVGLQNISFFGNITRRSLSNAEKLTYEILPEPWAPHRPLKTRRIILDFNVNKSPQLPSHISHAGSDVEELLVETEGLLQIGVQGLGTFVG